MATREAAPRPFRGVLSDGTEILVRAIRPGDGPVLSKGLRQLSPASRYGRFHSGRTRLSSAELRYLTHVDYRDHMAWLVFDATARPHEGLAVGRYVRLEDEPRLAEVAITVCDDRQGCGLGTLLFDALARVARKNGIEAFRAHVLAGNEAALRLARRFGAEVVPGGSQVGSSGGSPGGSERLRLDTRLRDERAPRPGGGGATLKQT